jgi:hypothetical protein
VREPRARQRVLAAQVDEAVLGADVTPAIVIASISANGSSSISTRSLKVPGSLSSALHTR